MQAFRQIITICLTAVISFTGCQYKSTHTQPDITAEAHTVEKQAGSLEQNITADELISQINVGYNIGNSLDSCPSAARNDGTHSAAYYETAWGNPVITTEYIDAIKAAGFNTVKFPVTWYYNTYLDDSGNLMIREEWLARVDELISYSLEQDLYVILDSHHDEFILWADMDDIDEVSGNLLSLWTQIATYFQDYDQHLVFEGFNELNTKGNSWKYSESAVEAVNVLNQLFVDTVRSCGGYNAERILICDTYLSGCTQEILSAYTLPDDTISDHLIIGVHCYAKIYDQDMDDTFRSLSDFSKAMGAPIMITEFGTTTDYTPLEYRAAHAGNYVAYAADYRIKCLWWDDGDKYSLFDRTTNTVSQPNIIDALMTPVKFHVKKVSTNSYNTFKLYTYGNISNDDGSIIADNKGVITLTADGYGIPVTPERGYHITLSTDDNADGLRLCKIAFYDSTHNLLSYYTVSNATSYDITAPSQASYMQISIYNPWGYRSSNQYQDYLTNNDIQLEITEYYK